jgi:transposase
MPPCLIGMEACVGAHHLSRKLKAFGHDARLMPAKYVRPYSKRQKNDFRDAETIAEVVPKQARPRAILSCSNSRLLITFFEAPLALRFGRRYELALLLTLAAVSVNVTQRAR